MVTATVVRGRVVVIGKLALLAPAGTTIVAGSATCELLERKATVVPAAGATPVSLTVPVVNRPPTTEGTASVTPARVAGGGASPHV